jgi:hypothetical protein
MSLNSGASEESYKTKIMERFICLVMQYCFMKEMSWYTGQVRLLLTCRIAFLCLLCGSY